MTLTTCKNTVSWTSIFSFILAASFLAYEMGVQVSPGAMATHILAELPLGVVTFGWVMSAYYYSYSAMMIPVGLMYDRYSAKRLMVAAVALCVLGGVLFATAHVAWVFAFARFFTGLGSAFAFIGVLVVAARCFPNHYYPLLVGITQLLAALGAIAGETPIAWATTSWGWRGAMWIIAATGLILMLALLFGLRGPCLPQSVAQKIDSSSKLVSHSLRQSLAIILSKAQSYWLALYCFCVWAPVTFFASLWGIPYLMTRYAFTAAHASYAVDGMWLGIAVGAPVLGWAVRWLKHRWLLLIAAGISCVASLAVLYLSGLDYAWVCVLCFLAGIGSAANILCFDLVQKNNPATEHAAAVGINNIAVVITGVVMQPAVGLLLRWHAVHHAAHSSQTIALSYHVSDYLAALWLMPACFALAAVVGCCLIRAPK